MSTLGKGLVMAAFAVLLFTQTQGQGEQVQVGAKAWKAGLKEWLAVLGSVNSFRSLVSWQQALRAAASHLQSSDNVIQQAALAALKVLLLGLHTQDSHATSGQPASMCALCKGARGLLALLCSSLQWQARHYLEKHCCSLQDGLACICLS